MALVVVENEDILPCWQLKRSTENKALDQSSS